MRYETTKNHRQPFRWLLALVIFILAMTITLAEVQGLSVPSGSDAGWRNTGSGRNFQTGGSLDSRTADAGSDHEQAVTQDNPGVVPEPGTLLLMGTGLGLAFWAARRRRK